MRRITERTAWYLPARASKQGNVIGSVSMYIYMTDIYMTDIIYMTVCTKKICN